ncbi:hypothetical protein [Pantoea sp. SOD02]|uniref:glycoside hydrolase family 19 protein n=1 Tax=Pantoea sp. SOD02 TaxID=2970818 RepID=UPI0021580452|nr:hypothetical protein [Pantoea sp. SOD02]UVC31686.1 hypothetical protein NR302_23110 [Pantoea sp. SOD02]
MSIPLTAPNVLTILALCGTAGMIGQGIRATIGLHKAGYLNLDGNAAKADFNASYLMVTLMIGFIAGCMSGIALGLNDLNGEIDAKKLLALVAAGYAGVDFIEGAFNSVVKTSTGSQPQQINSDVASSDSDNPTLSKLSSSITSNFIAIPPAEPLAIALKKVSPGLDTDRWVPALNYAFEKFEINSDRRIAAAIGQFMVEAGPTFHEIKENMRYTTLRQLMRIFDRHFANEQEAQTYLGQDQKLGNLVYANRLGNGDVASGDGFRYRGRGLIQLTGKAEYQEFANYVNLPVEEAAEWCETEQGAASSACWYLKTRNCLPDADRWDIDALTTKVNGKAKVDLAKRIEYAEKILTIIARK